ncbi:MAG TPA: hypothetical protein GYA07_01345 [Verrucomicrobia bacterium]|nr:hypothetical protein [Verrucomicrobiota bacterium]HOP96977.1 hypothetical protein [Verrucomicrobiota bacterium]HPU55624.1 hypothetical protein [Verrucomicrobiota bacterium]
MAEIVDFVNRGAATITPAVMDKLVRSLPQWKLEFTQIYEPLFPHLGAQLDFLANAIEDFAEGAYKELPYVAIAQACFALIYAHKKVGIIPDAVLNLGRADDSSVVRAVLIQNEKSFTIYAAAQNIEWSKITTQP